MGKKHKGKRGGGHGPPQKTAPNPVAVTVENESAVDDQLKSEAKSKPIETPNAQETAPQSPLPPPPGEKENKLDIDDVKDKSEPPPPATCIDVKIANAQPRGQVDECQEEERKSALDVPKDSVAVPTNEEKGRSGEWKNLKNVQGKLQVVDPAASTKEKTPLSDTNESSGTQTLSKRQKKKMKKLQQTGEAKTLEKEKEKFGVIEPKETPVNPVSSPANELINPDIPSAITEKGKMPKEEQAKQKTVKGAVVEESPKIEVKNDLLNPGENMTDLSYNKVATTEIKPLFKSDKEEIVPDQTVKIEIKNNLPEPENQVKNLSINVAATEAKAPLKPLEDMMVPEKLERVPAKPIDVVKVSVNAAKLEEVPSQPKKDIVITGKPAKLDGNDKKDKKSKQTGKNTNAQKKPVQIPVSPTDNSIEIIDPKCPYQHVPISNSESKNIENVPAVPPKSLDGIVVPEKPTSIPIKENEEVTIADDETVHISAQILKQEEGPFKTKEIPQVKVPVMEKSVEEVDQTEEIPLREEKFEESKESLQSLSSSRLTLESLADSMSEDMSLVVVDKVLRNISSASDEEILKLFDIVSKDFEKTPEPEKKPPPKVQEPMAQAGAALANLIQVVEKTESKIKESVEETKQKQIKSKKAKLAAATQRKETQDKTEILSDAVLVEAEGPSTTPKQESSLAKEKSPTGSKNGDGSDFVLSANPSADGPKSLLNNDKKSCSPVAAPVPQNDIAQLKTPNNKKAPKLVETKMSNNLTNNKNNPNSRKQRLPDPPKPKTVLMTMATSEDDDDDDEDYIEYKFSSRKVFLHTTCAVCSKPKTLFCPNCTMISYCSPKHCQDDVASHKDYCLAIQEVAKKRGGHVYNNAKILDPNDFRNLRVHTLNICSASLKRPLQPFEKEMLLFPRLCAKVECKNWKSIELSECPKCGVAFCKDHSDHLPESHKNWCRTFGLFQKLVLTKRIEPKLPCAILSKATALPTNMNDLLKCVYSDQLKDDCVRVVISQLATGPLTALNATQICKLPVEETFVVHLIGAELQFEGDTLDKWEAFFLHLMPGLTELRVVFVGPELNIENLPVEILSRIRMCRNCRQAARNVKFEFQCRTLYHDYAKSSCFTKPDLICYFNPGLYRLTGFNGLDTWPQTIKCSLDLQCPIVVTSYSEVESPLDMDQLKKLASDDRKLEVAQPPALNPFASQRPERNFISDHLCPMIFKNYFHFVVK